MIDVKKCQGIDCSGEPPWRYLDEVILEGDEQQEFISWVESLPPLFYKPQVSIIREWREASRIVGLMRGREGDAERIRDAKGLGFIWMGVVFGRTWFAVPAGLRHISEVADPGQLAVVR